MAKRSLVSLSKFLRGHQFQSSPKRTYLTTHICPARGLTQLGPDSLPSPSSNALYTPFPCSSSFSGHPYGEDHRTRPWARQTRVRIYGTEPSGESAQPEFDLTKEVDFINRFFAEAREEIEMAMESKETVYFDEEADCARDAVNKVLKLYEELLGKLDEKEKGSVQRSMGLKIEQLKAELKQLDD